MTFLYYAIPRWGFRWKLLLFASCLFYMAFVPAYLLVLLTTIVIDYYMAIRIAAAGGRARLWYLRVSILATCLVLFVFKYYNFFSNSIRHIQASFGMDPSFPLLALILPIGLSFHTFQSLSYVIEVYRGNQAPERHFGIYSLYVMFYPQLVAGPIERPQNLLHQFYDNHRLDVDNVVRGGYLIAWGFFQKMVVADRAAVYVNKVYGDWAAESGLALLLATLLFAVQIYADFAGYSSIAIGCARVMGFRLMTNFNHPYFADSISDFWRRWHISLATWFKDYVYIPLGGSRVALPRRWVNLLITFAISGLWHGANWTFVIWGIYNGALLVVESFFTERTRGASWTGTQPVRVMKHLLTVAAVCFGWVFFRAPDLSTARGIIIKILTQTTFSVNALKTAIFQFTNDSSALAVALTTFFFIGIMFGVEWLEEKSLASTTSFANVLSSRGAAAATIALAQCILLFGVLRPSSFIYFQF